MKASHRFKDHRLELEIIGEVWRPGDHLKGTIVISDQLNNENDPAPLLDLAIGNIKKVLSNKNDAFKVLEHISLKKIAHNQFQWEHHLSSKSDITDKNQSLYLLFGHPENYAHIALTVLPIPTIEKFCQLINDFYRFQLKEIKTKNGQYIAKFKSPKSKEFGAIKDLQLTCQITDQHFHTTFEFTLEQLSYSPDGAKVQKTKKNLIADHDRRRIFIGNNLDQQYSLDSLKAIFEQIKTQSSF